LSSDILVPRDHEIGLALGGEYSKRLGQMGFTARGGYRTDSDVDGFAGVSAGGGIDVGRVGLDFAWVPFGDLGNAYRYSLHIKFGDRETPKIPGDKGNVMQKASDELESLLNLSEAKN
jgi:hypothetical protein